MQKKKVITVSLGVLILILTGVMIFQRHRYNEIVAKYNTEIPIKTANTPNIFSNNIKNAQQTVSDNEKEAENYKRQGKQISPSNQQDTQISDNEPISDSNQQDVLAGIREKSQ